MDRPPNNRFEQMQESARAMVQRLYNARYILAAAAILALILSLSGLVKPWLIWLGFIVLAVAASIPTRSRSIRKRERMLRREGRGSSSDIVYSTCEALDEPVFILSARGKLEYQNRAATERFGTMVPQAHLSARLRAPEILEMVDRAIADKCAHQIDYVEKVPSERWYRVRIAPMKANPVRGDGGLLFLLTFRDQSEARRIDKMRTDFIANASHELRTPLASLSGFVETLQGPAREDPKAQKEFLKIMQEQAGRMTRLLDDLLSLSRLEMKAHLEPTDSVELEPLLRHVCDSLGPLADELGVEVDVSVPDVPVRVFGDRDELIQVFENLVENACKYGQSGKRVEVTLHPPNEANGLIEVSVRDFGPGIPREDVPRLTERFYRVNVEASRSKKGTGLGLAIVKHILTRHRARLIVHSTPGEGSEFVVRFSRQPGEQVEITAKNGLETVS